MKKIVSGDTKNSWCTPRANNIWIHFPSLLAPQPGAQGSRGKKAWRQRHIPCSVVGQALRDPATREPTQFPEHCPHYLMSHCRDEIGGQWLVPVWAKGKQKCFGLGLQKRKLQCLWWLQRGRQRKRRQCWAASRCQRVQYPVSPTTRTGSASHHSSPIRVYSL